jgi:hypothetical protein
MPPPLTPETIRRVDLLFPPELREEVIRILEDECGNNLPFLAKADAKKLERFRFAALKVSRGQLDRLRSAVALGKLDWRDLLMSAGFGNDITAHNRWLPPSDSTADPEAG